MEGMLYRRADIGADDEVPELGDNGWSAPGRRNVGPWETAVNSDSEAQSASFCLLRKLSISRCISAFLGSILEYKFRLVRREGTYDRVFRFVKLSLKTHLMPDLLHLEHFFE